MNNTDKLLRAFIEASGFEIESKSGSGVLCDCFNNGLEAPSRGCFKCQGTGTSHYNVDYKVTKVKPKSKVDPFLIYLSSCLSPEQYNEIISGYAKFEKINKG